MGYVLLAIAFFLGVIYLFSKIEKKSFGDAFVDFIFSLIDGSSTKRHLDDAEKRAKKEGSFENLEKIQRAKEDNAVYRDTVASVKAQVDNRRNEKK